LAGDVILEMDGEGIETPRGFEDALDRAARESRPALLRVVRRNESWYLALASPPSLADTLIERD
jgi:hypothetical protein